MSCSRPNNPRLLIRRLGGRYRNIMAAPNKRTAIFNQRLCGIGVRWDDNIEPIPYPQGVIRWCAALCAFIMRGGEELYLRDDICCQDLVRWYIEKISTKGRVTGNETTDWIFEPYIMHLLITR